jgi:hypothetical protein
MMRIKIIFAYLMCYRSNLAVSKVNYFILNDKEVYLHKYIISVPITTKVQGSTLTVVRLPGASEMCLWASENGTQLVRSGKWKWFCDMFNSWRAKFHWPVKINTMLMQRRRLIRHSRLANINNTIFIWERGIP